MNINKVIGVAVVVSLLVCGLLIAGGATGLGKKVTVTTVTAQQTWDSQKGLSVYNSSTNIDLLFLPNVTTNEFNTRCTANTTLIAAPGATVNLTSEDKRGITSVCYKVASSNAVVYINVF